MIDRLCFRSNGPLTTEFRELFRSLFDTSAMHEEVVSALASKRKGLSQAELREKISAGNLSRTLGELEAAGFVQRYVPYRAKVRGSTWRVIDEYSLFYKRWVEPTLREVAIQPAVSSLQPARPGCRTTLLPYLAPNMPNFRIWLSAAGRAVPVRGISPADLDYCHAFRLSQLVECAGSPNQAQNWPNPGLQGPVEPMKCDRYAVQPG
jgi:hypothetical protein